MRGCRADPSSPEVQPALGTAVGLACWERSSAGRTRCFLGVEIDELYYWDIGEVRWQGCFNHLVRSQTTAMPLTLTPERPAALGGEFVERCVATASLP